MKRVLLRHRMATNRAGRAASVRLSQQEWSEETNRMCFCGYIVESMDGHYDSSGNRVFDHKTVQTAITRIIEGSSWHVRAIFRRIGVNKHA